jgi:hypothetical protein
MTAVYKLAILVEALQDKIVTRVVRDLLTVQRLCNSKKISFVVACDEILSKQIRSMGIDTTQDFLNSNDFRCYSLGTFSNELKDRLLDGVACEFITIDNPASLIQRNLKVEKDPYAGVKLDESWVSIPPTMDLDRKSPSTKTGEPAWNPFVNI